MRVVQLRKYALYLRGSFGLIGAKPHLSENFFCIELKRCGIYNIDTDGIVSSSTTAIHVRYTTNVANLSLYGKTRMVAARVSMRMAALGYSEGTMGCYQGSLFAIER